MCFLHFSSRGRTHWVRTHVAGTTVVRRVVLHTLTCCTHIFLVYIHCAYTSHILMRVTHMHGSRVSAVRMSSSPCHLTFSLLMFHPSSLLLFLDGHFETTPDLDDLTDISVHARSCRTAPTWSAGQAHSARGRAVWLPGQVRHQHRWSHQLYKYIVGRCFTARDSLGSRRDYRERLVLFAYLVKVLHASPEDPYKVFFPSECTFVVTSGQGAVFLVDWQNDSIMCSVCQRSHNAIHAVGVAIARQTLRLFGVPLQECHLVGDEGGFHHVLESVSFSPQRTRKVEGSSGSPCPLLVRSIRLQPLERSLLVIARCELAGSLRHPCCNVARHPRKTFTLTSLVRTSTQGCDDYHCAPSAL